MKLCEVIYYEKYYINRYRRMTREQLEIEARELLHTKTGNTLSERMLLTLKRYVLWDMIAHKIDVYNAIIKNRKH